MIVLSADPGTAQAGVALLYRTAQRWRMLDFVNLRTPSKWSTVRRYDAIAHALIGLVNSADLLAVEDQFGVYVGNAKLGRTNAAALKLQGFARLVQGVAASFGKGFVEVLPAQARMAVGASPKADKKVLKMATIRMVRLDGAARERMATEKPSQHCWDAAAIGIAGAKVWQTEKVVGIGRRSA